MQVVLRLSLEWVNLGRYMAAFEHPPKGLVCRCSVETITFSSTNPSPQQVGMFIELLKKKLEKRIAPALYQRNKTQVQVQVQVQIRYSKGV